MYKILSIFLFLMFLSSSIYAMDNDIKAYYNAYNSCSPSAQKQIMSQCGYANVVERYYTSCMSQKGFGDADETMDKNRYDAYLENYQQCSVIANNAAQKECNYSSVYQQIYNKCMVSYGYDSSGERINPDSKESATLVEPSSLEKQNNKVIKPIGKFFDGIF